MPKQVRSLTGASRRATSTGRRFSTAALTEIDRSRILGLRAGGEPHRFTGVWVVVVKGRVLVRSWNDEPDGWYRAFRRDPRGVIQIPPGREIRVRAKPVRGERLLDAMDVAYAEKYPTPGSRKYVIGFALAWRRACSIELVPA